MTLRCSQCNCTLQENQPFCSQCGFSVLSRCKKCGHINPEQNKFCTGCGSQVKNFCPECGKTNAPDSKFCGDCACKLTNECPACNFMNLPGQKFCGNCNKQLLADPEISAKAPLYQSQTQLQPQEHPSTLSVPSLSPPAPEIIHKPEPPQEPVAHVPAPVPEPAPRVHPDPLSPSLEAQRSATARGGLRKRYRPTRLPDVPEVPETSAPALNPPPLPEETVAAKASDWVEIPHEVTPRTPAYPAEMPQDSVLEEVWAKDSWASAAEEEPATAYESISPEQDEEAQWWPEEVSYEELIQREEQAALKAPVSEVHPPTPGLPEGYRHPSEGSSIKPPGLYGSEPITGGYDSEPEAELVEDYPAAGYNIGPATEAPKPEPEPDQGNHPLAFAEDDSILSPDISQALPELEVFALASIELTKGTQTPGTEPNKQALDQFKQQYISYVQGVVAECDGKVETIHQQVVFAAFRHAASEKDSAVRAITMAWNLLQEKIQSPVGTPMKIRVGIDLEYSGSRNPIISTTERTIAKPGSLVVSEVIYQLCAQDFEFEPIGPLRVGNRMVTYYQVLRPQSVQSSTQPHAPEVLEPEATHDSYPEEIHHEHPQPVEAIPVQQVQHAQPLHQAPPAQPLPEHPLGLSPIEPYTPPVFGIYNTLRNPNFTYEKAYEAIASELSGFIEGGTTSKGKILSLCASEGLGKSYILDMLHAQINQSPLAQNVYWLVARNYRCYQNQNLPLYLWLDWLQTSFGMGMEGNPSEEARNVISQTLNYLYGGSLTPDVQEFFEELFSIRPLEHMNIESRASLGRVEQYLGAFIKILAAQKPVVMIIEDLNFADAASIDLLIRFIKDGLLEHPIYFIFSHPRHYYADGALAQCLQAVPYKEFVISELTEPESRKFLKEGPLHGTFDRFPISIVEQLISKSNGLPIYMVEVLRMLHLQGILELHQVPVGNEMTEKLLMSENYARTAENIILPETIEEIIWNRLHHVSKPALYVLQMASVIGEKFTFEVLQDVCGTMAEGEFQQLVKELFDHGWIVPDIVNTGRFCNGMFWQTVYHHIEPESRIQYHRLLSEYLQDGSNAERRFAVNPSQIAFHAHMGQLPNRAFHYWNLVGVHSTRIGSIIGVNLGLFNALSLLHTSDIESQLEWEVRIRENLGVLNMEENPELALQLLEGVAHFYETTDNRAKQIEILGFLATCHEGSGEFHQAYEYVTKVLSLIPRDQYPMEYATLLTNQLEYLFNLGKIQKGLELLTSEIEPLCAQHPLDSDSVYYRAYLNSRLVKAKIYLMQCHPAAMDTIDEALKFVQSQPGGTPNSVRHQMLELRLLQSSAYILKGNFEGCKQSLQQILEAIENMENPEKYLAQWGLVALAYHCDFGDWENASLLLPNTMYQSEKAQDYLTWMMANTYAGKVALGLGNLQEAKKTLENAITLSSEYRFATSALIGWRFLAETELQIGAKEVALEIVTRALEIAQKPEINNRLELFQLINLRAQCLLSMGQLKEAGRILEATWPEVMKTGFSPLIASTIFHIGNLYRSMATSVPTQEQHQKHLKTAMDYYQKSLGLWRQLGNPYQIEIVERAMR